MSSFEALGLSASLIRWIEAEGFTTPTEIQSKAIPILLEGRDLMGTAQTGEGKTAAYLLPILNRLTTPDGEAVEQPVSRRPQVLILAPTRELASQIGDALRQFSKGMRVYYTVVFGGTRFLTQQKVMDRGVQILIATPGRLMDHHRRGTIRLDRVSTLVLDEADRMLDMGFVNEVKEIAGLVPTAHQTMMFSATMSRGVRELAKTLLHNPERLDVGKENAVAANVDHRVMKVQYRDKKPLLMHLLGREDVSRVLIFTRTKAMADVLAKDIQDAGLAADAIHGDREQSLRQKVLKDFRDGRINILVATDVAARGIDVPDITHVINYDMPVEGDSYVHRVGRTGRAGNRGTALSIATGSEGNLIRIVERVINQRIPVDTEHPFHDARPDGSGGPAPRGAYNSPRAARPRKEFDKPDAKPHRKGPREKFAGEEQRAERPARPTYAERAERPQRQERRPDGERPYKKAEGERPYKKDGERSFKPAGVRTYKKDGDRPYKKDGERSFKPAGDRPYKKDGERPYKKDDKPFRKERPQGDRPHGDRPREERSERPARAEGSERPQRQDRDREWRPENRPYRDNNPGSDRNGPEKKFERKPGRPSDKKFGDKKFGAKKFEDRKSGEKHAAFGDHEFKSPKKPHRKGPNNDMRRDESRDAEPRRDAPAIRAKDGVTAFRSQDGGQPAFKKKKPFKKKEGSEHAPREVQQKTRSELAKKPRNRTFERETAAPERNAGGFKPRTRRS
ncbi:MAG: ATP-dependent helicase [Rhodospirillales bacterium]|nr:ATP-dependent helicase [Rhodospirillales bacterium]